MAQNADETVNPEGLQRAEQVVIEKIHHSLEGASGAGGVVRLEGKGMHERDNRIKQRLRKDNAAYMASAISHRNRST